MKNLKLLLVIGFVCAVIGGAIGYFMYNKPHQNVADAKPEKVFTADELYTAINGKDSTTIASFKNKIYQVSGVIGSVVAPNDSTINILLAITGSTTDNINCSMDPKFNKRLHDLKAGDKLTVKGIFSGVNKLEDKDLGISTMDIILSRGVVVRE